MTTPRAITSLPRGLSPEARVVVGEFLNAGWTCTQTSRGHLRFNHPDGIHTAQIGPKANKANRGVQNALSILRRHPVLADNDHEKEPPVAATPLPEPTPAETIETAESATLPLGYFPVERADGSHYQWIVTSAGGHIICTHPGCDYTSENKRGIHLHELAHNTPASVRAARAKARGEKGAAIREQKRTYANAAVEALADYFGIALGADAEEHKALVKERDALAARVEDLEAKLALIKEATRL